MEELKNTTSKNIELKEITSSASMSTRELTEALLPPNQIEAWLEPLGLTEEEAQTLGIHLPTLHRLVKLEFSPWSIWRLANLEIFPEKFFHFLAVRQASIAGDMPLHNNPHLWTAGRSLPLRSISTLKRVHSGTSFVEGTEVVIQYGLKLSLSALLLYQLASAIRLGKIEGFFSFIKDIFSGNQNSIFAILQELNTPSGVYLEFVFAAPVLWGIGKAIYAAVRERMDNRDGWQKLENYFQGLAKTNSFWQRSGRWLFPFAPGDGKLSHLARTLCWHGGLTNEQRDQAFRWIKEVATGGGYAKTFAWQALARIVHGISLKQWQLIRDNYDESTQSTLLSIKAEALSLLEEAAPPLQAAWKKAGVAAVFYALYAHYLKWTLADSSSRSMSFSMLIFTLSKTGLSLLIVKSFLEALINYLRCPNQYQQGFTLSGGLADWASLNTQACFEQYVRLFNTIPGQPIDSLLSLIPSFNLGNMTALNLSNKGLYGQETAQILKALKNHGAHITTLDLSGNLINYPIDFEALLPELTNIIELSLSNNQLGLNEIQAQGLIVFSQGLAHLTQLQILHLARNAIGSLDKEPIGVSSTISLGQGLSTLTQLRVLSLAENNIGSYDYLNYHGTQALAEGIGALAQLKLLNISINSIGFRDNQDARGTEAFGEALGCLLELQILDLSWNKIGYGDFYNISGTQAIGHGIGLLKQLQYLNLMGNSLGFDDAQNSGGTQAIAQSLCKLPSLQFLNLWNNGIGLGDAQNSLGTQAIGKCLRNLIYLESLNLGENQIGSVANSSGTLAISEAFSYLPRLTQVSIMPLAEVENSINNAMVLINAIRQLPASVNSDLPVVIFPEEAASYFSQLCSTQTRLNLRGKLKGLSLETWEAIGSALANCTQVTFLDLSENSFANLDNVSTAGTEAIANALSALSNLQYLYMSLDNIGEWDHQTSAGTQALGQAIASLAQLQVLDLSENWIGRWDVENSLGTQSLAQGISKLINLRLLNLSGNDIGGYSAGTGQQEEGTAALASSIRFLRSLVSLNLSRNFWGRFNSTSTQMLGEGLSYLSQLRVLDLQGPPPFRPSGYIGSQDDLGVMAIANGIRNLTQLCAINLDSNQIGSTGSQGVNALLAVVPQLPQLKFIDLAGIQNVTWTQAAQALANINDQQLQSVCYAERCFGRSNQMPVPVCQTEEYFENELEGHENDDGSPKELTVNSRKVFKGETGTENSSSLHKVLQNFWKYPCHLANWCLDKFIEGTLEVAHEAIEAGGAAYGRQKSVYEACSGVTMFNSTHVYIPGLAEPCQRLPLLGR